LIVVNRPSEVRLSLSSRLFLILALILLPLLGVGTYAGPSFVAVVLRLVVDGAVVLLWLVAAGGIGASFLAVFKFSQDQLPPALRLVTCAGVGLGIIGLIVLGLGLAGLLGRPIAWAIIAMGAAMSVWQLISGPDHFAKLKLWLVESAGLDWLWLLATPFLATAITGAMTPPGFLWGSDEPNGYDVVEYHLQVPREWYESHRIQPLPHNIFSYTPFNVEMHYLLGMHLTGGPWAGMYVAQLMHLAFFALTVAAIYGIARRQGPKLIAIIAAMSLLTVPWLTQLSVIAYDEGGFLLFATLAIGWTLTTVSDSIDRLKRFALAGGMAGFAAGSKLTAVPEVLAAIPLVIACLVLSKTAKKQWGARPQVALGIAVFCLMGFLTFSPWLIRNIVWTRNPIFPELMPVLGRGDLTTTQMERWDMSLKPPPTERSIHARLKKLFTDVLIGWQFGYVILPLGLIALGMTMRRPEIWFLFGLLLILTVFWLSMTHLQARFFVLAVPICAMLAANFHAHSIRAVAGGLILVAMIVSWVQTSSALAAKLYATGDRDGVAAVLGRDGRDLFQAMFIPDDLPKDAKVLLVGDAKAFLYPIPMTRLRYRTVFDVRGGGDLLSAWIGVDGRKAGEWMFVDPIELKRFSTSYHGLPPLPPAIAKREECYVEKPK
jgi:4-amino-4-deoxy-L-arabinose transferase-like glycosyltransferase